MSLMNQLEVEAVVSELERNSAGSFDKLLLKDQSFAIGLWSDGQLNWFQGSLAPQGSFLIPVEKPSLRFEKIKKPLTLFFKAHFSGVTLKAVQHLAEFGRVFRLLFGEGKSLEIRLFPGGANLLLTSGDKTVSFRPVKELAPVEGLHEGLKCRSFQQLRHDLLPAQSVSKNKSRGNAKEEYLSKQKTILLRMQNDLKGRDRNEALEAAKWIEEHNSLDLPRELTHCIESSESLAANRDRLFEQGKKFRAKLYRLEERIADLTAEIHEIEEGERLVPKNGPLRSPKASSKKRGEGVLGRTFVSPSGHKFFVGKSSKDNLKLLRQARSWDLWFHLQDQSSAHGILRKEKKERIGRKQLEPLFQFFLQKTLGARAPKLVGEKFNIIVAEVRYITPIKGDKHGSVTVRNESAYLVELAPF